MKWQYIIKRLLLAVPTFFGITIIVYTLSLLAPGSPLDAFLADPRITPLELERKRAELGLDQNILVQYWNWLTQLLKGNLGYSIGSSQLPVSTLIKQRLSYTLLLSVSSLLLALCVSIPIGVLSASKPNTFKDYILSGFSFFAIGTPNFFLALVGIYIFAVKLKWLPTGGVYDSGQEHHLSDLLSHMILPVIILSLQYIGSWVRYIRSSMIEVSETEYMLAAKAKGIRSYHLLTQHALKNSLLPFITVVGMAVPQLIGGAVITERIFSWPGIGSLMVSSILARDYPVIMGITVLLSCAVLITNLFVDILYGLLDPRITYR